MDANNITADIRRLDTADQNSLPCNQQSNIDSCGRLVQRLVKLGQSAADPKFDISPLGCSMRAQANTYMGLADEGFCRPRENLLDAYDMQLLFLMLLP